MLLEILSPEKQIFEGKVYSVTFPGSDGSFQVLNNHAPLISFLSKGEISYIIDKKDERVFISSGIVEILENKICALVEKSSDK
tara:strand:- start:249 stop:497 length:249 start_codon:yes stop_codon:yes gene_type:complete